MTPFPENLSKERIIETSLTSDTLYVATNEWLADTVNDAQASIEFFDKENGKIIGNIISSYSSYSLGIVTVLASFNAGNVQEQITQIAKKEDMLLYNFENYIQNYSNDF